MHPFGSESLRWLEMSEKLLTTRDLIGSKSFATKALESDPNSEAAEQILAIVDTLIAGEKEMSGNNNHLDWYSILQLARRSSDLELIGLQYKRLGVLLNPNRNKYPFAEHAYKLVTEAWLVLSNPSRKFRFDNEFGNSISTHFNFIQTPQQQQQLLRGTSSSSGGSGSGLHYNFMQEGSGEQLQFVQQQVFAPQALSFFGEEQEQQTQSLTDLLRSDQGKQPLIRPQPHQQQTWFQQPEPQTQPHQPSHWAQSQKLQPESREQSTQPLHWAQAQHEPQHPTLSQPQPQSWMQQALARPEILQSLVEPPPPPEPREQPLHSSQPVPQPPPMSQPVPQPPPMSQPQPWMQDSLPSPQIQTSSPELRSQPEKTPPEPQEWVNNGEPFNLGENDDNHDNNVNEEELSNFWTVCAYCYSMYEYSGIYADCTIRCQNCKKAFHAVKTEAPPSVVDGEDAYICCWGYFPVGISMSYLEKRKAEASSWQPFSKMFAFPQGGNIPASPQGGTEFAFNQGGTEFAFNQGGNTSKPRNRRNSGPRIYIDDDDDYIFDSISSNEESDDDDWRYAPKNKKARSFTRKVSTATKVKQPKASKEMVQYSNTGNLHSGVVAQDGSGISGPDVAVPIVPEAAVPRAAMDDADKNVIETSKNKAAVPIRKQPSRAAKDSRKLDVVVGQEVSGASVPDAAKVSLSPTNQPKDCGKADGVDGVDGVVAQEGSAVDVSDMSVVSVPTRKQPDRDAKGLEKLDSVDVVVAQGGSVVIIPDTAAVSTPARKQPGRVAKDSGKLNGSSPQEGSGIIVHDSPVVSVTTRKQPSRVAKDSEKLDGAVGQAGMGVGVPDVAAPSVSVAESEKKAVGSSSKKKVYVPTRKQPGRVAKDLGKLDLNVEFNNEVEGPARGSGGSKSVNGAEENVDGVAFFEGLDEYLSSLPILSTDAGDKAKAV